VIASIRVLRRALALGAAVFAAGCVSSSKIAVRSYTLDPPPPKLTADRPVGRVVSLARVRVAPPYAGTSFVYRVSPHRVEHDPYAIFAAPPGWMLTSAIRGYLRNADFIRDVVEPGGELPVFLLIEAEASELCADLPDGAPAAAVLSLQFRVYSPASGVTPERELLRKTYSRTRPLAVRDSNAIADAWNQELSEIVGEFVSDLRPLLPPP
jgi:hypothetical protein